jgi:rhodanese-related sulfurtransferase
LPSLEEDALVPSTTEITAAQLSRLIGLPASPRLVDVRIDEDWEDDPRLLPGSRRHDFANPSAWQDEYRGRLVIVVCQKGLKLSQGVAAWLRHAGFDAQTLEGGFEAWRTTGQPLLETGRLPPRDSRGRTVWVTRERPKIDRIACPWLIRRFVDPDAAFLFVAPSEVLPVAERFNATPFDIDGVFWSHRGPLCTFDTDQGSPQDRTARAAAAIVPAPHCQARGGASGGGIARRLLGFRAVSRRPAQLRRPGLYDAFYRWCRDATRRRTTGRRQDLA